jgi:hypothetical protein
LRISFELQYMILSYMVVEQAMIPLPNARLISSIAVTSYSHSERRCGYCRGFDIKSDEDCRCVNSISYSTSCRCVSLFDGIFLVSKEIRIEAMRLYWSENTFLLHDCLENSGLDDGNNTWPVRLGLEHDITTVPLKYFRMIRRLVADTPSDFRSPWD